MELISSSLYEIKKSKFYSYLYELDSLEEINLILENLKKENKKAKHFPFAYWYESFKKKSDDKEPSGTAGKPLLQVLERNNLNKHLLVVIRYFGGVKLGAGPLLRSYSKVSNDVIKK